eukprot:a845902_10.p1 GENE.a845902_10~~a845902_10.p1  ORF type:complete len:233 (+),score=76.43 a845902_10:51-701(+)
MAAKSIGVIGSGQVAQVLAAGFKKHGHAVMLGTRDPAKLAAFATEVGVEVGSPAEAAAFGAVVLIAVKGTAAVEAAASCGDAINGKTVIDACNPIADEPPENGILRYFTTGNDSLMERLQKAHPLAKFVKAFSCVGNAVMIDPKFGASAPPTMFICGNDADAKAEVVGLLAEVGWEACDIGAVQGARAIEPLCQLWCAPGFLRGDWAHAFKYIKPE